MLTYLGHIYHVLWTHWFSRHTHLCCCHFNIQGFFLLSHMLSIHKKVNRGRGKKLIWLFPFLGDKFPAYFQLGACSYPIVVVGIQLCMVRGAFIHAVWSRAAKSGPTFLEQSRPEFIQNLGFPRPLTSQNKEPWP